MSIWGMPATPDYYNMMNLSYVNKTIDYQNRNSQQGKDDAANNDANQQVGRVRNYDTFDPGVGIYEKQQAVRAEDEAVEEKADEVEDDVRQEEKADEVEDDVRQEERASEVKNDARQEERASEVKDEIRQEEKPDYKAISLIKNSLPSREDTTTEYDFGDLDAANDSTDYANAASETDNGSVSGSGNGSKLTAAQQKGVEVYQRMQSYQNPINLSFALMAS